jgi:predicted lipid carrier protein YhbT
MIKNKPTKPRPAPPLPLFILQPVLRRLVRGMARRRPEVFARLGMHRHTSYLIDPVNLPFVFLLRPDPVLPVLEAFSRRAAPPHDARISGSFLTLLDMVDGRLDGDALFFSRRLRIEGDVEAVVALRNALDDGQDNAAEDMAGLFGAPGKAALAALRLLRSSS